MIPSIRYPLLVQMPDGKQVPLQAQAVIEAFCDNQRERGGLERWQIEQIAEALIHYLRVDLKRDSVEMGEFVWALSALVSSFEERTRGESIAIVHSADLYHLAQETGYGFELAFFREIERVIAEMRRSRARNIQFTRLRPCVKLLLGARNWCRSCQDLSDEIVGFIRHRMLQQNEDDPVSFAVSP